MSPLWLVDLGLIDYSEALDLQRRLVAAKKAGSVAVDFLFLLEHPPVLTLGRRGDPANIRVSPERLAEMGIAVHTVERGGDVTYHGPGQLVGYPILDLTHFRRDVSWFVTTMQRTVQATLADYGIESYAQPGQLAGLWVREGAASEGAPRERKIMAQGVRIERWVTFHGFALNVTTNLAHFDLIVPCGISDKDVTSMARELGAPIPMAEVKACIADHFQRLIERPVASHSLADVAALLTVTPA